MKSLAKSWKANPIIAVVIPSPATIDLTLIPKLANIASITSAPITYFIIFSMTILMVLARCF